jgi:hypothetical protein
MTRDATKRRREVTIGLLASLLVLGLGCPDGEETSLEARPFDAAPEAERKLAFDSVESSMPDWAGGAYPAWRIEWEGTRPARLRVERYRPGDCLLRARYRYTGEGELSREAIEAQAKLGESGSAASTEDILLPGLAAEAARRPDGQAIRTDVAGRLVWSHRREVSGREGVPDVEVMAWVTYEPEACILPAVLRTRQVPAKQTPARAAQ